MHAQHWTWIGAGAAFLIAIIAGIADWRRLRRKRVDDYGWMPWRGIQVAALFAAIVAIVIGFKQA